MSTLNDKSQQIAPPILPIQIPMLSEQPDYQELKYLFTNAILPILTAAIFLAFALIHFTIALISKKFYMLPLAVGCLVEVAAYVFHAFSIMAANSTTNMLNFYILFALLNDLAPCLFLTTIGLMLQRVIKSFPRGFPNSAASGVSNYVISLEILSFVLQTYALMVRMNPSLYIYWWIGNMFTAIGCGIESLNLVLVWVIFLLSLKKRKKVEHLQGRRISPRTWRLLALIVGCTSLILIRSLSKLVSYSQSRQLRVPKNEVWILLLHSLPLQIASLFLVLLYPRRCDSKISETTPSFYCSGIPRLRSIRSLSREGTNITRGSVVLVNREVGLDDDSSTEACTGVIPAHPYNLNSTPSIQILNHPTGEASAMCADDESFWASGSPSSTYRLSLAQFSRGIRTTLAEEPGSRITQAGETNPEMRECDVDLQEKFSGSPRHAHSSVIHFDGKVVKPYVRSCVSPASASSQEEIDMPEEIYPDYYWNSRSLTPTMTLKHQSLR